MRRTKIIVITMVVLTTVMSGAVARAHLGQVDAIVGSAMTEAGTIAASPPTSGCPTSGSATPPSPRTAPST